VRLALALVALVALIYVGGALLGLYGEPATAGDVTHAPIPAELVASRAAAQAELARAAGAPTDKQGASGARRRSRSASATRWAAMPGRPT
jgi:hypothetical protein